MKPLWYLLAGVSLVVLLVLFSLLELPQKKTHPALRQKEEGPHSTGSPMARNASPETGPSTNPTSDRGLAYLEAHREELQIQPYHELRPVTYETPDATFLRYHVYQDDVPVWGMYLLIKLSKAGDVISTENHYRPIERVFFGNRDFEKVKDILPPRYTVLASVPESRIIFAET